MLNLWALALSIFAGLAIHLFFRFISHKSREATRDLGEEYVAYLSVSQHLSEVQRRRVYYAVFRQIPPVVICVLLCGVLNKAFPGLWTLPYLVAAIVVAHSFSTFRVLFRKNLPFAERIVHLGNLSASLLISVLVSFMDGSDFIESITPSLNGIVDNVWAALFVSLIVVGYFEAARKRTASPSEDHGVIERNFVHKTFMKLYGEHSTVVEMSMPRESRLVGAFWAILVFEDMNRPKWVRSIERVLVRFPGLKLTVGVAQVRSSRPLSDAQSITLAAKSMIDYVQVQSDHTDSLQLVKQAIRHHNGDDKYVENVLSVYEYLPEWVHYVGT